MTKNENAVDLSEKYIVKVYSSENNLIGSIESIKPDENGNISLCFEINAENMADVAFYDVNSGEEYGCFGILADNENTYSFSGFDRDKTYNMEIRGGTQGEWIIEGSYTVY